MVNRSHHHQLLSMRAWRLIYDCASLERWGFGDIDFWGVFTARYIPRTESIEAVMNIRLSTMAISLKLRYEVPSILQHGPV
jgi:hypothetical protein